MDAMSFRGLRILVLDVRQVCRAHGIPGVNTLLKPLLL
jgi:hypothetical protein